MQPSFLAPDAAIAHLRTQLIRTVRQCTGCSLADAEAAIAPVLFRIWEMATLPLPAAQPERAGTWEEAL